MASRSALRVFGLQIILVVGSLAVCVAAIIGNWPPTISPDFAESVQLTYKAPLDEEGRMPIIRRFVDAFSDRLNMANVPVTAIRGVGLRTIEIVIPGQARIDSDVVRNAQKAIARQGTLEFAIVANTRDHSTAIHLGTESFPKPARTSDGKIVAHWVVAPDDFERMAPDGIPIRKTENQTWILVIDDVDNVSGRFLQKVSLSEDQTGQRAINFVLDAEGERRMSQLTKANLPDPSSGFQRKMAVILNGRVNSAPNIMAVIGGSGVITGRFTSEELDRITGDLIAGTLPAMEPPEIKVVPPAISIFVTMTSLAVVALISLGACVYLIARHRLAGIAAVLASVTDVLLVVAMLELLNAIHSLRLALAIVGVVTLAASIQAAMAVATSRRVQRVGEDIDGDRFTFMVIAIGAITLYMGLLLVGVYFFLTGYVQSNTLWLCMDPVELKSIGLVIGVGALAGSLTSFTEFQCLFMLLGEGSLLRESADQTASIPISIKGQR